MSCHFGLALKPGYLAGTSVRPLIDDDCPCILASSTVAKRIFSVTVASLNICIHIFSLFIFVFALHLKTHQYGSSNHLLKLILTVKQNSGTDRSNLSEGEKPQDKPQVICKCPETVNSFSY